MFCPKAKHFCLQPVHVFQQHFIYISLDYQAYFYQTTAQFSLSAINLPLHLEERAAAICILNLSTKTLQMRKVIFNCLLLLFGSITTLFAQYTVTGRITDSSGTPVANATVSEKGSSRAAVTDNNGNYKLNASKQNATLTISIVGFKTQEITANGAEANVQLQPGNDILETITVVGSRSYGRSALNTPVPPKQPH
jgi:hypothetical protein